MQAKHPCNLTLMDSFQVLAGREKARLMTNTTRIISHRTAKRPFVRAAL